MKKSLLLLLLFAVGKSHAQWSLTGNTGTNPPTQYIGTTDAKDLVVKTNATERLRVLNTNGNVGIGTASPSGVLEIKNTCQTTPLPALVLTNDNQCFSGNTGDLIIGRLYNTLSATYTTRFIVTRLGLIGVNVAAPASQLEVQSSGSSTNIALFKNNSGTAAFSVLNSGNTGIGTASPAARFEIRNAVAGTNPLQVYNASSASVFVMKNDGSIGIVQTTPTAMLDIKNNTINDDFRILDVNNNTHFIIQNAGNVGIGVSNPTTYGGSLVVGAQGTGANALDLVSTATTGWCNQLRFDNASGTRHLITDDRTNNYLLIKTGNAGGANDLLKIEGNMRIGRSSTNNVTLDLLENQTAPSWNAQLRWIAPNGTTVRHVITEDANGSLLIDAGYNGNANDKMKVAGNAEITGTLQIGSQTITSGTHTNAKLCVDGKIAAKACVVTLDHWADYVFEENYTLQSFKDLEQYINIHKHLPSIPSEEEMTKGEHNLGEMDVLLLSKIEELYLYIIQLNKEKDLMLARIKQLETL